MGVYRFRFLVRWEYTGSSCIVRWEYMCPYCPFRREYTAVYKCQVNKLSDEISADSTSGLEFVLSVEWLPVELSRMKSVELEAWSLQRLCDAIHNTSLHLYDAPFSTVHCVKTSGILIVTLNFVLISLTFQVEGATKEKFFLLGHEVHRNWSLTELQKVWKTTQSLKNSTKSAWKKVWYFFFKLAKTSKNVQYEGKCTKTKKKYFQNAQSCVQNQKNCTVVKISKETIRTVRVFTKPFKLCKTKIIRTPGGPGRVRVKPSIPFK